jgi:Arc/MetJ-type ribon-helix-helix transcriptional regulator
MKTLSVKIPDPLAKWLLGESKESRRSRSELVREALEAKRQGSTGKPAKRNLADALLECGGTFDGPADLSTNPRHLEGFGE